ncbi:hypothetical protein PHJA_002151500, partial [Phtheirospermum japonicum]
CVPSSCGNIPNISHPFRLKDDPKQCCDPDYELSCENNTTLIYFHSHKYLVQAINYSNYTIRLTDATIENNSCSFPKFPLSRVDFRAGRPYSVGNYTDRDEYITSSITFMSCPYPVTVNNSLLLEADAYCAHRSYGLKESNRRHTYIMFGNLNGSCVMNMCTIDLIVMTSLPHIHSSLLYGFELSWFSVRCSDKCRDCWFDGERPRCFDPGKTQ